MSETSACLLAYYSIIVLQLAPESFASSKSGMEKQEVAQRVRGSPGRNSSEEVTLQRTEFLGH